MAAIRGKQLGGNTAQTGVCYYWLAGRCTRSPCKFLHSGLAPVQLKHRPLMYEDHKNNRSKSTWRNPDHSNIVPSEGAGSKRPQEILQKVSTHGAESKINSTQETQQKVLTNGVPARGVTMSQKTRTQLCQYWVTGNCVYGDKCKDLHSWFCGTGFSMLTKLGGHKKVITGITIPCGSSNLYTGSKDRSVRVWDCNTGQCAGVLDLGGESGSLISEGPWLFAGLPNAIKAWNVETHTELVLNGPVGQVYAMAVSDNMFLAGTEDGTVLVWKYSSETNNFEPAASLKGHTRAIVSLVVGAKRLYSGSVDKTIRVWDLETGQCIQMLSGHTDVVMSVLCWDSYLLSGSLDQTIKVWAATENGNLQEVYERNEGHGVLALCGIHDAQAKPILLCSCNDNAVRLYDLPTFDERGRIFAKREVRTIQIGSGGLFFTGDALGQLCVWKLDGETGAGASS